MSSENRAEKHERFVRSQRDAQVKQVIKNYERSSCTWGSLEWKVLRDTLRNHDRPVRCGEYLWMYSRGDDDVLRLRADTTRRTG